MLDRETNEHPAFPAAFSTFTLRKHFYPKRLPIGGFNQEGTDSKQASQNLFKKANYKVLQVTAAPSANKVLPSPGRVLPGGFSVWLSAVLVSLGSSIHRLGARTPNSGDVECSALCEGGRERTV